MYWITYFYNTAKDAVKVIKTQKTIINERRQTKRMGIGGIFFKSENPNETKNWFKSNLGLNTDQWGTSFEWYQGTDLTKKGYTQWSPFDSRTKYYGSSSKDFMINYRVVHLEKLLAELIQNGVTILDKVETFEYGKFVHILDNEGNKIELSEPIDTEFDKVVEGRTK